MPRSRNGRPNLRVIEGGGAPANAATTSSTHESPSLEHGAPSGRTTAPSPRSSQCDQSETTRELRVLVCGSRTWEDVKPIYTFLKGLRAEYPKRRMLVAHGAAQGADTMGDAAAQALDIETCVYPAQWGKHGKRAGFLRNHQMIEEFKPHLVLACSEHPITKGTQHTVNLAKKANIPLYLIGHG